MCKPHLPSALPLLLTRWHYQRGPQLRVFSISELAPQSCAIGTLDGAATFALLLKHP